jgi:hypothetical protein
MQLPAISVIADDRLNFEANSVEWAFNLYATAGLLTAVANGRTSRFFHIC